jgi:hypothetical protein
MGGQRFRSETEAAARVPGNVSISVVGLICLALLVPSAVAATPAVPPSAGAAAATAVSAGSDLQQPLGGIPESARRRLPVVRDASVCYLSGGARVPWYHTGVASPDFKIWACGTGDYETELRLVRLILDSVAPQMMQAPPAGMGKPIPDLGTRDAGGDKRIDVYLLEPEQYLVRNGRERKIKEADTLGLIVPADPFGVEKPTASSFILVNREKARANGPDDLRRSLIHEFFHSLQYAHNYRIKEVRPEESFWFYEASAAWAEWHYFRQGSRPVHDYFLKDFKNRPEMILEKPSPDQHAYASYLWPFFMQQQAGGSPAPIFQAWVTAQTAQTWEQMGEAVDKQLRFKENFKEFAARNLNLALEPGNPIAPRYVALDPNFPDRVRPELENDVTLANEETRSISPSGGALGPLAAQYDRFVVPGSAAKIRFDFTGLTPGERADVVTFLKIGGTWERRDVASGGTLEFCLQNAQARLEEAYVVLANHDRVTDWEARQENVVGGSYTVRTSMGCGKAQATGTITWNLEFDFKTLASDGSVVSTAKRRATSTMQLRFIKDHQYASWKIDPWSSSYVYSFVSDLQGTYSSTHAELHGSSVYGADDHILDPKLGTGSAGTQTYLLYHLFGMASGFQETTSSSGTQRKELSGSFATACPAGNPGTAVAGVEVADSNGARKIDFTCTHDRDLTDGNGSGRQRITVTGALKIEPV